MKWNHRDRHSQVNEERENRVTAKAGNDVMTQKQMTQKQMAQTPMTQTPQASDERMLRRFLLGDLAEEERARIEELVLNDTGVFEQLGAIEDDLIDAYARDELPAAQRSAFEQWLHTAGEQKTRVALAKDLDTWIARRGSTKNRSDGEVSSPTESAELRPFPRRRSATYLPIAASLLLLLTTAGLIHKTGRLDSSVAGLSRQLEGKTERVAQLERRLGAMQQGQQLPEKGIVPVWLAPQLRGPGEAPRVILSPAVEIVRLQLDLGGETGYRSYRVRLESASEQVLWSWQGLVVRHKDWGGCVIAELPAGLLAGGSYQLALEGITAPGEAPQQLAFFDLTVVQE